MSSMAESFFSSEELFFSFDIDDNHLVIVDVEVQLTFSTHGFQNSDDGAQASEGFVQGVGVVLLCW